LVERNSTDSIASAIHKLSSEDLLNADETSRLAALFAFCERVTHWTDSARPDLAMHASVSDAVERCQFALALSTETSALDLPDRLESRLNIFTWRLPLAATTGGYFISKRRIHIVVANHVGISPWMCCARQMGRILSTNVCHNVSSFEASRFDNTSERRTLRSSANMFAMELLAPPAAFIAAVTAIRRAHSVDLAEPVGDIDLLWLSRVFGVSFFVAGKRAEQLGLLPRGASVALTDMLCEKHGGPELRAKTLGLPPRPDDRFPNVPRSVMTLITQGLISGDMTKRDASLLFGHLLDFEPKRGH